MVGGCVYDGEVWIGVVLVYWWGWVWWFICGIEEEIGYLCCVYGWW